jgi:lipopolysaccharide biosynthesis protein
MISKHYRYIIICHLFYESELVSLLSKIKSIAHKDCVVFFNLHLNISQKYKDFVKEKVPGSYVFSFPNKGRDIGAKLFLLHVSFTLGISADYTIIIHDKKSPHLSDGNFWAEDLQRIIHPDNVGQKIPEIFSTNADVGIVCSKNYIQNEYDMQRKVFNCTSNKQIQQLIAKYELKIPIYDFVAGSMFVIRYDILKKFFNHPKRSIPAVINDFEEGNALDFSKGTFIHAWERFLSWIATSQGFRIYGI